VRRRGDLLAPKRKRERGVRARRRRERMSSGDADTVGSLLGSIATALAEALRILMFADKRQWGPDEFEQIRALEEALDDAKKDFQGMAPLLHGQYYYEGDRTRRCFFFFSRLGMRGYRQSSRC
jgi:hypothetical protein